MKRYLSIVLLVFLSMSMSTVVLADNSGSIIQYGDKNYSELYQYGADNIIDQNQKGYDNYAYAYQDGNGNLITQHQQNNKNNASATQIGNDNIIEQYGYGIPDWSTKGSIIQGQLAGTPATNLQVGNNNIIIKCQGLTGIPVVIKQIGNGMEAFIY